MSAPLIVKRLNCLRFCRASVPACVPLRRRRRGRRLRVISGVSGLTLLVLIKHLSV